MREVAIIKLDDLKELNDFIDATNDKAMTIEGLVVASDGDIKSISADIKELKQREDILKIAESKLIKLAGIDRAGFAIENSRKQRLLANKNVQNAKQKIKDNAINYFVKNATELIGKSQAQVAYKSSFDLNQMALDTIAGKSKDLMSLMKTELSNLGLRLDNNARETSEKLAIINKYDGDMVRDGDSLLQMSVDLLSQTLINRKHENDRKIKVEAERLAQVEAERLAQVEAETPLDLMSEKGDWYCPKCKNNLDALDALNVTNSENCDTCGSAVLWVETTHIAVPIELLEAVAHIGVDTGYGIYKLEKEWIDKAREIFSARKL